MYFYRAAQVIANCKSRRQDLSSSERRDDVATSNLTNQVANLLAIDQKQNFRIATLKACHIFERILSFSFI